MSLGFTWAFLSRREKLCHFDLLEDCQEAEGQIVVAGRANLFAKLFLSSTNGLPRHGT